MISSAAKCYNDLTEQPLGCIRKEVIHLKKTIRKLAAVLAAAVMTSGALAANSSALTLCIGGKCYSISIPSDCNIPVLRYYMTPADSVVKPTDDCTSGSCADTSPAPSAPTGGETVSSEVNEVLSLVNSARDKNGLSPLTLSKELCAAAEIRAKETVRSFSHTRPNGTSCFTVLKEEGIAYRTAGENIAYGQRSASAVMNAWLNSPGHRANILGKNFGKIGIACYTMNGVKYWVQLFTN